MKSWIVDAGFGAFSVSMAVGSLMTRQPEAALVHISLAAFFFLMASRERY